MAWPSGHDYNDAVQDPGPVSPTRTCGAKSPRCPGTAQGVLGQFRRRLSPAIGRLEAAFAVKCFTKPVADRHERYHAISEHLQRTDLPFAVAFTYQKEGIRVRGPWYPVVKMDWVEGLTLTQFVRGNLDQPPLLES